jgi:hypothetical protein
MSFSLTRRQVLIFQDMDAIAHIEMIARYLSDIDAARGFAGSARAITLVAAERARDILLAWPRTVSAGDVVDVYSLLDLSRRRGEQIAARHSLDKIAAAMEKPNGGYMGGFALVEAGHMLARWGQAEDARDQLWRATRMARSQPLRDPRGFDVRFMILIHAAQRAWESQFPTMAREILDEAEALRTGAYQDRDDLKEPVRILRERIGGK